MQIEGEAAVPARLLREDFDVGRDRSPRSP